MENEFEGLEEKLEYEEEIKEEKEPKPKKTKKNKNVKSMEDIAHEMKERIKEFSWLYKIQTMKQIDYMCKISRKPGNVSNEVRAKLDEIYIEVKGD